MSQGDEGGKVKRWIKRFEAGKIVFNEGDTDTSVYILVEGNVEVLRGGERVAVIDVGDTFIGEISALTGQPRSASVRTTKPSTMLVVSHIEDLLAADSSWSLKLARTLARRLLKTNERLQRVEKRLREEQKRVEQGSAETMEIVLGNLTAELKPLSPDDTLVPST